MGLFNNRELASLILLTLVMVWALRKAGIRRSLKSTVRAFFRKEIIVLVLLMVLYTGATVTVLRCISIWNLSLLKDTIVWFWVGAMPMIMHFMTSRNTENIFRKVAVDSIRVIIVLEFLVNTYTFPFVVELIIVPTMTLVAMLDVVSSTDKKFAELSKFTKGIQVVVGCAIVVIAIGRAILDWHNLASFDSFRSIALAPILCLLFTPFLYIAALISNYQQVFVRLNIGVEKEAKFKRYVRRRVILHVGLSLRRLQHLDRNYAADFMRVETKDDVDRLLKDALI